MEVILLTKVANLGDLGEKVNVRPGYARNFLIPGGKARFATAENLAEFEARHAELQKMAADSLTSSQARKSELDGLKITIAARSTSEGKLFGSVGAADIADALKQAGKAVTRKEISMPSGVFRHVGEYQVELHLHTEVNATITLEIVGEE